MAAPGSIAKRKVLEMIADLDVHFINFHEEIEKAGLKKSERQLLNQEEASAVFDRLLPIAKSLDKNRIIYGFPKTVSQIHYLRSNKIYPNKVFIVNEDKQSIIENIVERLKTTSAIDEHSAVIKARELVDEYYSNLMEVREAYREISFDIDSNKEMPSHRQLFGLSPIVSAPRRAMNIIIAGPPTSGRSRVTHRISDIFKLTHISMQSLLNDYVSDNAGSEEALDIKRNFESGGQTKDEIVNALFASRFVRKDAKNLGTCLDGFPKTESQANYFKNTLKAEPNFVFILHLNDQQIYQRNHILDPVTGKKYLLSEAQSSGDYGLLNRINNIARENEDVLQKRIDHWELAQRTLNKYYEQKIHKLDASKYSENQIVEMISHTIRKFMIH